MDITQLQVSCWRGKFLLQAQSSIPSTINLYTMEQWALRTWVSYSYGLVTCIFNAISEKSGNIENKLRTVHTRHT